MNELMTVACSKQVIKKYFYGGWCHHSCTSFAFEEIIDLADCKLWIFCKLFQEYCSCYHYLRYYVSYKISYKILMWSTCAVWGISHHWNILTKTDFEDYFSCDFPLHNLRQSKWFSSEFILNFWINQFSLSLFL